MQHTELSGGKTAACSDRALYDDTCPAAGCAPISPDDFKRDDNSSVTVSRLAAASPPSKSAAAASSAFPSASISNSFHEEIQQQQMKQETVKMAVQSMEALGEFEASARHVALTRCN